MQDVIAWMFYKFPRYVGIRQRLMEDKESMVHHMKTYSGVQECFTSVYSFFHGKPVIDKAFFDIDHEDAGTALKIGQKLFKYMKETFGLEVIPFWSGIKGVHLYPLFKPKVYSNASTLLKNFSYHVIDETKCYDIDENDGKKQPQVDTHVIGDVRRLGRYPNTQRVSYNGIPLPCYCIPLDPETFLDLTVEDVLELRKTPQLPKFEFKIPTVTLDDLKFKIPNLSQFKASFNKVNFMGSLEACVPKNNYGKILKYTLKRPCLRHYIFTTNPPDAIRVATTAQLCNIGLSTKIIMNMYGSLGWHDWNEEFTGYQIESIRHKNLTPYGKKKMQEYGFCMGTDEYCKRCK